MTRRSDESLKPRNGHTLVVTIVARISGCQNQKELSLEDQEDHGKEVVAEMYTGPVEYRVIATKGKGDCLPPRCFGNGWLHKLDLHRLPWGSPNDPRCRSATVGHCICVSPESPVEARWQIERAFHFPARCGVVVFQRPPSHGAAPSRRSFPYEKVCKIRSLQEESARMARRL